MPLSAGRRSSISGAASAIDRPLTNGANISRQLKLNRRTYLVSMVMMPARLMLKLPVAKMLEKLARNNGAQAAATATKVREKGLSTTL